MLRRLFAEASRFAIGRFFANYRSTLANDAIRRPDYIHRSTIRNWRTGTSKTVKDWRQLVAISSALRLDEEAATQLLLTGGCASIRDLRATARDDEKHLFALWPEKSKPVVTAEKPNVALATEHSAALDTEMAAQETEPARATSPFPLSFRIAAISALTGLLLIVALGFILNRPTEEPTPPTDPDLAEATEAEATETESTASSDSSDDASADESSPDESSADDVSHIDTVDPDTPIITIYDDSLRNGWGWQEGSSNTEAKVQSSEIVYAGEFALCTTIMEYGALALRPIEPLPVTPDHHIEFQIHGTDSISGDLVFFVNNEEGPEGHTLTTIDLAGKYIEGGRVDETSWRAVSIPLRDVGFDGEIVTTLTEINIHSAYAGEVPTIFLDDIQIVDAAHARKINNPADGRYIVYRDKMHPLWSWSDSSWNAERNHR